MKPFTIQIEEKKVPLSGAEAVEIIKDLNQQFSTCCGDCGKEFSNGEVIARHSIGYYICQECAAKILVEAEIIETDKVCETVESNLDAEKN